jgi:hypothetical protein
MDAKPVPAGLWNGSNIRARWSQWAAGDTSQQGE